jgi:hypothetical protein
MLCKPGAGAGRRNTHRLETSDSSKVSDDRHGSALNPRHQPDNRQSSVDESERY